MYYNTIINYSIVVEYLYYYIKYNKIIVFILIIKTMVIYVSTNKRKYENYL